MFKRVLLGTDLSQASLEIVNCVGWLKDFGVQEIILTHCLNIWGIGALAYQVESFIKPTIENQRKILEEQGFDAKVEIVFGSPPAEINRVAKEKDCSLIVIGSHGHSLWKEALLGGVATNVLYQAQIPTLVIRLKICEKEGQMACEVAMRDIPNHILFPTDFSDNAEYAFTYVEKFVERGSRRITLMHVQDKVRIEKYLEDRLNEFNKIDQERLERLKAKLCEKGATEVNIEIPYGSPTQEILKQISKTDISLVIMGSQGRGFFGEIFLGSVSHKIARHAPVSVLLIPAIR